VTARAVRGGSPAAYVSTSAFRERDLAAILGLCAATGIDALELSAVSGYDRELLRSPDRPAHLLVHNYFPPPTSPFVLNLASQDSATLARSRAHCRAAIDLSAELSGSVYAAHAGFSADVGPRLLGRPHLQAALPLAAFAPYELVYQTLVESARELTRYGRERGVTFLLENHVLPASAGEAGRRLFPMVEAEELLRLASDVGEHGFGLLVDVGHLSVSAATLGFDREIFLDVIAEHVRALHLSSNDGRVDQHLPFDADAWFLPRLRDFPEATVTIEVEGAHPGDLITMRELVRSRR
jgi:sugar phosphate isomerase/epimerase